MKKLLPLLALLVLFPLGCDRMAKKEEAKDTTEAVDKTVIARVNGRPIYKEDLKGKPLDTVIDFEILYDAGVKQGVDKQVAQAVEDYKKRLVVTTLQRQIVEKLPKDETVTEEEIQEYYKQNEGKYKAMSFKQLIVTDKDLADQVQKRAMAGEDFDKIASDMTKSGTTVEVKDLRFNRRFNDLFAGKEVGSVSEVITEGNKFVILKLTEVKEVPLDKAKQAIKYTVAAKKRAQAIHDYAEQAKKDNNISVEILEVDEGK
ncbi:MAG: peptidyl-prolyl cis-trans isomerase [Candidatus Dadabacteria bacterium]|nr:peptidyl-prolyl cis-trans isomerase [Candidatus Dadabacteria bacterium]